MKKVSLDLDDYLFEFYKKVGENSGGLPPETVMADALFKFAGELSMKVLNNKNPMQRSNQK